MAATFRGTHGVNQTSSDGLGGHVVLSSTTAGALVGDLMLVVVAKRNDGIEGYGTMTPPAGWTQLQFATGSSTYTWNSWSFYRFKESGDTTFTWTGMGTYRTGLMLAYEGAAGVNNSGVVGGGGTNRTTPVVTATVADVVVAHFYTIMADSTSPVITISVPTGTTSRGYPIPLTPVAIRGVDEVRGSGNTQGRQALFNVAGGNVGHVVVITPGIGRSGTGVVGHAGSGVKVYAPSTIRSGAAAVGSAASGAKILLVATDRVKVGSAACGGAASGVLSRTVEKTGFAASGHAGSGAAVQYVPTVWTPSGAGIQGSDASAILERTIEREGSAAGSWSAAGGRELHWLKQGSAALGGSASGERSVTFERSGSAAHGWFAGGDNGVTHTKAGETVVGFHAAGVGGTTNIAKSGEAAVGFSGLGVGGNTNVIVSGEAVVGFSASGVSDATNIVVSGQAAAGHAVAVDFQTEYFRLGSGVLGNVGASSLRLQVPATYTTAGSIRTQLVRAGVTVPIFRDAPGEGTALPYIVVREAESVAREGVFSSYSDPQGHIAEDVAVEIWQQWRNPTTSRVEESYTLPDQVAAALTGTGLMASAIPIMGVRVRRRTRRREEQTNRVVEALTVEVHRTLATAGV
jgi:hypothetical protein